MLNEQVIVEAAPTEAPGVAATLAASPAREYRCSGCGYGAIVRSAIPSCPMCGGSSWEQPLRTGVLGDSVR
jgi:rubrerythrin